MSVLPGHENLNGNDLNHSNTSSKGSGNSGSVGTVTKPIIGPLSLREFIDEIQDEIRLIVDYIQCGPSGWPIAFIEQKDPTYFGQNLFDAFQELYRMYARPMEDLGYYEHEQGLRLVFKVSGTDIDSQRLVANRLIYYTQPGLARVIIRNREYRRHQFKRLKMSSSKHKRMRENVRSVIRCGLDTIEER